MSLVLCAAVVGWAWESFASQVPPSSNASLRVASVRIEGAKALPADRIKRILTTQGKRFRFFDYRPFDEGAFLEDLDRIEKYYRSEGFYHARVVSHKVVRGVADEVQITIRVEEGPPMVVSRMTLRIDGEDSGPLHEKVLSLVPLKSGSRFSTPAYRDCEKAILQSFADDGRPKAQVDMNARLDKGTNSAQVSIDVATGPVCTFGRVIVEGNKRVGEEAILRELRFEPGERFSASKVVEGQRRLFNMRLFQFVDVSVLNMEDASTELPIRILVKEAKKQTVRLGVGYGTEEELRGKVQWEIRNFLGDARQLQVNAKASALGQLVEGNFIQPWFLGTESAFSTDAGWARQQEAAFENNKFFITPRINYSWTDEAMSYVGYNLEANRLESIDAREEALPSADRENEEYYVSSMVEGLSWERVDDVLNPKEGFRLIQTLEWASIAFGSEVDYIKLSLEGRGYLPLRKYGVLAARLKWGGIRGMENTQSVPIFKRFFSGGSNSVRGYPYQRLGPLDDDGEPIGGLSLLEFNLDWRFPIPVRETLEGVVFLDSGNVYEEAYNPFQKGLRYTTGVGVRYQTPVGPVRLDIGYQLNPPDQDFFDRYEIHFSIGQAF